MRAWVACLSFIVIGCRTHGLAPVDPCAALPEPCGANAQCKSTGVFYTCICDPGFIGDGRSCHAVGDASIEVPDAGAGEVGDGGVGDGGDGGDGDAGDGAGDLGDGGAGDFGGGAVDLGPLVDDSDEVLAAGDTFSCALGRSGQLWCWGGGSTGTDGALATVATEVGSLSSGTLFADWRSVVAGPVMPSDGARACGLRRDGSLWCWGNVPVPVGPASDRWRSFALGANHLCGIKSNGTLYCWGTNDPTYDQLGLGLGTSAVITTPTQVGTANDWRTVASRYDQTCAIRADGSLWCWGANVGTVPHLQSGPFINSTPPTQIGSWHDWRMVRPGRTHTCALRANGALYCWQAYGYYLWTGTSTPPGTPTPVVGAADWKSFSSGGYFTACGVRRDGTLWCMGEGYGVGYDYFGPPKQIGSDGDWDRAAVGIGHVCARKIDGRVLCWGTNQYGQLGNGRGPEVHAPGLVGAPGAGITDWQALSVGSIGACGIRAGGTIWCWGSTPFPVAQVPVQFGSDGGWSQISTGGSTHTCALKSGALYCWGDNSLGELGAGPPGPYSPTAIRVGSDDDWERVVADAGHTCGLRGGGQLYCWGAARFGGLGIGTLEDAHIPTPVGATADRWIDVSIGGSYGCAVRSDGKLFCWGTLVRSDPTSVRLAPVQVGDGTDWQSIRIGGGTACGRRVSPTTRYSRVWCWGYSSSDELGDLPDRTLVPDPIALASHYAAQIAVGQGYLCTLGSAMSCWGSNSAGQLGDDVPSGSQTFLNLGGVVEIGAGSDYSCARKSDGTIWCWGGNKYGQLGNSGLSSPTPEPVVNTPL